MDHVEFYRAEALRSFPEIFKLPECLAKTRVDQYAKALYFRRDDEKEDEYAFKMETPRAFASGLTKFFFDDKKDDQLCKLSWDMRDFPYCELLLTKECCVVLRFEDDAHPPIVFVPFAYDENLRGKKSFQRHIIWMVNYPEFNRTNKFLFFISVWIHDHHQVFWPVGALRELLEEVPSLSVSDESRERNLQYFEDWKKGYLSRLQYVYEKKAAALKRKEERESRPYYLNYKDPALFEAALGVIFEGSYIFHSDRGLKIYSAGKPSAEGGYYLTSNQSSGNKFKYIVSDKYKIVPKLYKKFGDKTDIRFLGEFAERVESVCITNMNVIAVNIKERGSVIFYPFFFQDLNPKKMENFNMFCLGKYNHPEHGEKYMLAAYLVTDGFVRMILDDIEINRDGK